MQYISP
jgi:hypothetical protein